MRGEVKKKKKKEEGLAIFQGTQLKSKEKRKVYGCEQENKREKS